MTTTKDTSHDVLVAAAQHSIAGHADTDSRIDRARRTLAAAAPIMLAPALAPAHPLIPTRRRIVRFTTHVVVTIILGLTLTAGVVYYAVAHGYLELPGTSDPGAKNRAEAAPDSLDLRDLPLGPPVDVVAIEDMLGLPGYYTRLAEEEAARLAEEEAARLAEEEAARLAEEEAARAAEEEAAQATEGGQGATVIQTPPAGNGGTTPPPAEPGIASINVQAVSGYGSVDVDALVATKNGSVVVTATASIAGIASTTLSGLASLDGSATYSGTLSGIPAGDYTVTVTVNGQTLNVDVTVY